jgi:hypothetical protein
MIRRGRFLAMVEECLGGGIPPGMLASEEAERTAHAVLSALGPLGEELAEPEADECEPMPLGGTVQRVASQLGLPEETTRVRIRCVLRSLAFALAEEEHLPGAH